MICSRNLGLGISPSTALELLLLAVLAYLTADVAAASLVAAAACCCLLPLPQFVL